MATCRPCVSIYSCESGSAEGSCLMPSVFMSPLRPDIVRYIHTNMAKNRRQAYGVKEGSGYQTSAMSWGTGRAVARIPRVQGGGTHRAGQAAFGNFCRDGGMFAPTKVWRRWHRKINITEKRHAVASALAASGLPPLVMGRGHRIDNVPELPLVVNDKIEKMTRTKEAISFLEKVGCIEEIEKVKESKKVRAGVGKMRNRKYVMRKGPLIIYNEDNGIKRAFRNIPGIELCHIDSINLLQIAPGGTLGRFIIWTASSFNKLKSLYGNHTGYGSAPLKKNYHLQRSIMMNADISRIINSDEIQSSLRPMRLPSTQRKTQKKNPLKNHAVMCRVNPVYRVIKKNATLAQKEGTMQNKLGKKKNLKTKEEAKKNRKNSKKFFSHIQKEFDMKKQQEEAAKNKA